MAKKRALKKPQQPPQSPEPQQHPAPREDRFDRLRYHAVLYMLCVAPVVFFRTGGEFENSPKMALLQWGTGALALLSLLRTIRTKSFVWKRSPLDVPMLVFYGLCWLSLLQAANPWQGVFYLLHWGAAILFYFLLVHSLGDERRMDGMNVVVAVSMIPVGIIGVVQWLAGRGWISRVPLLEQLPQMTVPAATFSNSNMVALVLAMALPLSVSALLFARTTWIRAACAASLLCNLLLLVCTRTRGAWLAAIAVLLVMAGRWAAHTRVGRAVHLPLRYLVAAALCILVLLYFPLQKLDSGSTTLRWIWWKNTALMIKDHPLRGVGLGNFKIVYPLYHRAAKDRNLSPYKDWSFGETTQLTRTHNDHLQILAETGAVGFSAYLWLFVVFILMVRRILAQGTEPVRRRAFYILLSFLAFCIVATTNFPLERALPPFYLFMCFAFVSVLYRNLPAHAAQPARGLLQRLLYPADIRITKSPLRQALTAALCVLIVLFVAGSFTFIRRMVLADRYFVEALGYSDRGRLDAASQLLEKAKDAFSDWNFNIASLLGRNYTMQEQYDKAIQEYRESLRVHPNNTNALLNTGYCYLKLGKLDEAEQFFKRFLEIMPDVAKGYNNLGIIYFSKKNYPEAERCYAKAFELDPGYAEAHVNLGNVHRAQGNGREALQEYETALRIKPDLHDVRTTLVNIYIENGEFEKAEQTIRPLLQNSKTALDGHLMLGGLYQQRGRYEQALFQYLKAVQLAPRNAQIYHRIGLMHLQLGNTDKAEKSFEFALQHDPSLTDAATMLGQLRLQRGDERGALDIFLKALQTDPRNSDLHFNAGTIYLLLNDLEKAQHHYRQTIALDPNHSLAHYNLGAILRHQGRLAEALPHLEKALENPVGQIDQKRARTFIAEIKKALAAKTQTPP